MRRLPQESYSREETKGRFCKRPSKRLVLASLCPRSVVSWCRRSRFLAPSFRFLVPSFRFWAPSFRFLVPGNIRQPFGNHFFANPNTIAAKFITKYSLQKYFLEAINFVIITKTRCIQLERATKRPPKYHKNNCFRELFCNNFGQDGTLARGVCLPSENFSGNPFSFENPVARHLLRTFLESPSENPLLRALLRSVCCRTTPLNQSRILERGCHEALFSEKRGFQ